jgi:hypothetical protein
MTESEPNNKDFFKIFDQFLLNLQIPSQLRPSQLRTSQLRQSQLRTSQLRPSQLQIPSLQKLYQLTSPLPHTLYRSNSIFIKNINTLILYFKKKLDIILINYYIYYYYIYNNLSQNKWILKY